MKLDAAGDGLGQRTLEEVLQVYIASTSLG